MDASIHEGTIIEPIRLARRDAIDNDNNPITRVSPDKLAHS
jgi:hypothetical protein